MKIPYHPSFLFSAKSFEMLTFLVIREEYPNQIVSCLKPPDGGIDVLRENGTEKYIYQCKHYPKPELALIRREIRNSMVDACKTREIMKWRKITLCISGELTWPQRNEIDKIAKELGLKKDEFAVWSGKFYYSVLLKKPYLWEQANSPIIDIGESRLLKPTQEKVFLDGKLEKVIKEIERKGDKIYISELLEEHGITSINSLNDFYQIAKPFYMATKSKLRMMSFDSEISAFWMSASGDEYLKMNKGLISKGVELRRIFVFDLESLSKSFSLFKYYLAICTDHGEQGVNCRIIDSQLFSEFTPFNCKIFGTQDDENVVLYAPYGFQVNFLRDKNLIKDAIDAYDDIFFNQASHTPKYWLEKYFNRQ